MELLVKSVIAGIAIAIISTVSERLPSVGAILIGIPVSALISLIFMWHAGVDPATFRTWSFESIYYVLTSLAFFVIFGYSIMYYSFWISMMYGAVFTALLFYISIKFIL